MIKIKSGAEGFLRIEFWNANGPLRTGHVESKKINAVSDWVQLTVSARVPSGATEARILAFSSGRADSSAELVCFDDFSVTTINP